MYIICICVMYGAREEAAEAGALRRLGLVGGGLLAMFTATTQYSIV